MTPRTFLLPCLAAACLGSATLAADPPPGEKPAFTNRLAKEKSPYLLQHAHNPVDWYPWGDEAFAKAKKENKPVLLSIGYATCHWCHVMERESFMNEKIAAILNGKFVAIKLDREERPDLDNIYMTAAQAMQVGGGWPLNMFLTPDRQPFFGGTYFAPKSEGGRPGFGELLELVASRWEKEGAEIQKNAAAMAEELKAMMTAKAPAGDAALDPEWIAKAVAEFMSQHDDKNGGFSKAPKFPQPAVVSLVLRHAVKTGDAKALAAVVLTCDRMAAGGMHDQLGGGFARYSVDDRWLVPHFEKMLYDNAQLASLYLDVAVATGEKRFGEVARGIFRYVLRDMALPDGGFASAEDADSEGHEGKFYCWTLDEVKKLLGVEEAALAISYWGLTEEGNFVDHSRPDPLPKQNILHIADPAKKLSSAEAKRLETVRSTLLEARSKRIRPLRDDKVLASWNGLMLSALAKGAMVLGDDALLAAAKKNASFMIGKMFDLPSRTLSHRWREGEKDAAQLQKSYALVLQGMLDLYQADPSPATLDFALALAESMTERFYDKEHGGFYQSAEQPGLIVRSKDEFDDVEPSGNGAAIVALTRLAAITDRREWRERAEKSLKLSAGKIKESPAAFPYTLQAVPWLTAEPFRVVITGDPASPTARSLRRAAFSVYQPDKVVLGVDGPVEPFAKTLPAPKDGKNQAFVCTGKDCRLPTSDPKDVSTYLSGKK